MNTAVRERIDPNGTLPKTNLIFIGHSEDDPNYEEYLVIHEWQLIGEAKLIRMTPESLCFRGISLEENIPRPKGVGLAAYVAAIEIAHARDMTFTNDGTLTDKAANIWRILDAAHVVTIITPLEEVAPDCHTGVLVIPPSAE
jgi:hypothetical protein